MTLVQRHLLMFFSFWQITRPSFLFMLVLELLVCRQRLIMDIHALIFKWHECLDLDLKSFSFKCIIELLPMITRWQASTFLMQWATSKLLFCKDSNNFSMQILYIQFVSQNIKSKLGRCIYWRQRDALLKIPHENQALLRAMCNLRAIVQKLLTTFQCKYYTFNLCFET